MTLSLAAQEIKDRGIEKLKWPNLAHINVDAEASDLTYRKYVYNYGGGSVYAGMMASVFNAEKEGRITRTEQIRIFSHWKAYATAVINNKQKEKTALNVARASARILGTNSKYKLVLDD